MIEAHLDRSLIREQLRGFPNGRWERVRCCNLFKWRPRNGAFVRIRKNADHLLPPKGGVYAFFLPRDFFSRPSKIRLYGPKKRKILFSFKHLDFPRSGKFMVVYVGKTNNPKGLEKRIWDHFEPTRRKKNFSRKTFVQVQRGVVECGLGTHSTAAKLIHKHGELAYTVLPGDENSVNRDIVEISLIAKFRPPFNVKAEH